MELPLFMSPEHVRQMNDLLAASPEVHDACRELERPVRIAYRLSDGPDGREVYWEICFSPERGMRFALDAPTGPVDVTLRCDWSENIAATAAIRRGSTPSHVEMSAEGDTATMESISSAWAAANSVAVVAVRFPDIGRVGEKGPFGLDAP